MLPESGGRHCRSPAKAGRLRTGTAVAPVERRDGGLSLPNIIRRAETPFASALACASRSD